MSETNVNLPKRYIPYAIIAAFPGHKPKAIGHTHNRVDADAMVRFLQRRIPHGAFYVIFTPPEDQSS
jgi:hypothetical protein